MLEVRMTADMGRGVFASAPIPAGMLVARCTGWIARGAELQDDWHAMQIGPDLWLCSAGDALDDCINHSCDPNVGFATGQPELYALRDIAPGEQICWDYSTSIAEAGWTLQCRCKTQACRGIILSWWELAEADRARLERLALAYLRRTGPIDA